MGSLIMYVSDCSDLFMFQAESTDLWCFPLSQVVAVYGTLSDLLSVASNKLGIKASCLYNGKGGLIDDIALIRWAHSTVMDVAGCCHGACPLILWHVCLCCFCRDDDVLYVSEGDPFIGEWCHVKEMFIYYRSADKINDNIDSSRILSLCHLRPLWFYQD